MSQCLGTSLLRIFLFLQRLKPLHLQILLTFWFVICRPMFELTRTAAIGSQSSSPWFFSKHCPTTPCLQRGCSLAGSPCFFHLRHHVSRALWMLLPSAHGLSGSFLTYSWRISSVLMLFFPSNCTSYSRLTIFRYILSW